MQALYELTTRHVHTRRPGLWLLLSVAAVALAAVVGWPVSTTNFEPRSAAVLPARTEMPAFVDASVPRATEVRFADADPDEPVDTF